MTKFVFHNLKLYKFGYLVSSTLNRYGCLFFNWLKHF
jgi:hypothetical protein